MRNPIGSQVVGRVVVLLVTIRLRHQPLDVLANHPFRGVSKHHFSGAIEAVDPPMLADRDDRVGGADRLSRAGGSRSYAGPSCGVAISSSRVLFKRSSASRCCFRSVISRSVVAMANRLPDSSISRVPLNQTSRIRPSFVLRRVSKDFAWSPSINRNSAKDSARCSSGTISLRFIRSASASE